MPAPVGSSSGRGRLSDSALRPVELLEEAVAQGVCSAAVLHIQDLEGVRPLAAWPVGRVSSEPEGPPVRLQTLFDLASVTKLFSAVATLRLVDRGVVVLTDELIHLLEHRSGLPAWAPLYEQDDVLAAALAIEPEHLPGEKHAYSDIGFLHLLDRLQHATGKGIAEIVDEEVLSPLGLVNTSYRSAGLGPAPIDGRIAVTENCPRRGILVGEVSDGNTYAMGGASTHAGLFGPASDLALFAQAVWDAPEDGYLSRNLWSRIWATPAEPGTHVMGWDSVAETPGRSSAGTKLSRRSRGHLGFTGTSLWIDPERAIAVVLLTNRVHPSRDDNRIRDLRPRLHDAVADMVDKLR